MVGWAIAVHGGAGVDPNLPTERQEEAKQLLTRCLNLGISALRSSASAIDVVELVVRELESDPIFNSGRGSALTEKGTVEMEASIMDGNGRRCGAVSGLTTVKNPVSLARLVMDKSPHSYLAFSGAENFAEQMGVEREENDYFITEDNVGMLKIAKEANSIVVIAIPKLNRHVKSLIDAYLQIVTVIVWPQQFDYRIPISGYESCGAGVESPIRMNGLPISVYTPETVGCVVVDSQGNCAAATSTGGLMNKRTGRIGDSPLIGAGTYACNVCGVSCTGEGEAIIRGTLAREVAAVMEYKGLGLQEAVDFVINERLDDGKAGLIAVSNTGEVAYGFNCVGMFRGCATEDGFMEVGIWE
ncbi:probable isoaspartyl peptidase/L-asparaginase 2 [Tanacetum coccineum]